MVEIEVANRSGKDLDLEAASDLIREVLQAEGIDFHDGTIDGEIELAADIVLEVIRPFLDLCQRLRSHAVGRDWNTPLH